MATSGEIMAALEDGFTFLKLFPAEAVGGVGLLKAWASPFGAVSFCPTGGITSASAANYLALPNVRCVGGSWLTPADALRTGDWGRVTSMPLTIAPHDPPSRSTLKLAEAIEVFMDRSEQTRLLRQGKIGRAHV